VTSFPLVRIVFPQRTEYTPQGTPEQAAAGGDAAGLFQLPAGLFVKEKEKEKKFRDHPFIAGQN
jgi:hypothetical protein